MKGVFRMKKYLALLLVFLMLFSTLMTGCGGGESDEPAGDDVVQGKYCTVAGDSDIVVLNYSDVSTLFPADYTQVAESAVISLAYQSLLAFDENQELYWVLATGCDANEAGTEYTFYLREGITFSDGEPWNADAAKANLDMVIDDSLALKGVSRMQVIESTEVIDEYTIKVTLANPYAPFLNVMANFAGFVSPKLIEEGAENWNFKMVGTGPYTLEEYRSGESIYLKLNRNYWGYDPEICGGEALWEPHIGFNSVTIKPVSEEATRIAMLQTGEADIINPVTASNIPTVEAGGGEIFSEAGVMVGYLYFNCQKPELSDPLVRQAITKAIDVEALNKVVYGGKNVPGDSIAAPSISYYVPQERYEYNIEEAKKMLEEAGIKDGLKLVAWEENDTSDIQRGEFINQQLAKVGIELEVYPLEGGVLSTELNGFSGDPKDTEWDIYIRGYSASTFDPDQALGRFTTSQFMPTGANYSYYSNPKVDELCAKGASTIDPAVRAEVYKEVQEIMWEDMPAIPLLVNSYVGACNSKIEGFTFKPGGGFFWDQAYYVSE